MKAFVWIALGFLAWSGWYRYHDRFESGVFRITFLDVGQGDSVLLRFPRGTTWLVDAGGGFEDWDRGKREIFLELARKGILTLDAAILSHPDQDHGFGFRGLFDQIRIDSFVWNSVFKPGENPLLRDLLQRAAEKKTESIAVSNPRRFEVDGVSVEMLPIQSGRSKNNNPLVLRLEFGGCRVLLAGDAEKGVETLLNKVFSEPLTVLKANHHGSATSSTESFLRTQRPAWTAVSVGFANSYHHPDSTVMARLEKFSRVLRTDRDGFVEFTFSADGIADCNSAEGACGNARCNPVFPTNTASRNP